MGFAALKRFLKVSKLWDWRACAKPELREQYARRVKSLRESPAIQQLRSSRTGLVLCGGGAKGAYQAGALQVLRDVGLNEFAMIAGTSVGALNGLAFSMGRVDELVEEWRSMTLLKVANLTPSTLPLLFGSLFGTLFYCNGRISAWLIQVMTVMLILLLISIHPIFFILAFILLLMTINQITAYNVSSFGLHILESTLRRYSLSSARALRKTTLRFIGKEKFQLKTPTYLTIARREYIFDPDDPTFQVHGGFPRSGDIHYDLRRPAPQMAWLPDYVNVAGRSRRAAVETALKSASLPGVFQYRRMRNVYTSDGGLADNMPIRAAIDLGKCEALVIIHLNNAEHYKAYKNIHEATVANYRRVKRLERLAAFGIQPMWRAYLKWLKQKDREFRRYPSQDHTDYRNKDREIYAGFSLHWDVIPFLLKISSLLGLIRLLPMNAEYYNLNRSIRRGHFHQWDLIKPRNVALISLPAMSVGVRLFHITPTCKLNWSATFRFSTHYGRRLVNIGIEDCLAFLERLEENGTPSAVLTKE